MAMVRMALGKNLWLSFMEHFTIGSKCTRYYRSKAALKKLRPMILKRIERRSKEYPVQCMVPIAHDVLKARALLIQGVHTLLKVFPIMACKFCSEVYIGEEGHLIRTCHGYRHHAKNKVHEWVSGGLNDILVPVETFHLNHMFQKVIKHEQRFDYDRVPAVVELCLQAGANLNDEHLGRQASENLCGGVEGTESLSPDNLLMIANGTLRAWETLRSGVQKLLLVYPTKVCKYCSEIHIGPSGHMARLCGIFKHENWRGKHFWKIAGVDDLVPPKIVWQRRPQDPPVLLHEQRGFYGHAHAVVDLCTKAGVVAPSKYFSLMKKHGLPSS